jgi:DNA-binding MarR family transcriptional regulator
MTEMNMAVLMFIAFRHAEQRIMDYMVDSGYDDVTLAQGRLFARIGEEGTRLTELAEAAQVTKQTAGFLVDQLEKARYVERVPDPTDARARLVKIAPRGRNAQARARVMERTIEDEWERHLGKTRMRELRRALNDLRELTDPYQ